MNKIVRDHYPAANLPEDLRQGLEKDATVRIVIEEESPEHTDVYPGFGGLSSIRRKPMTAKEAVEAIKRYKAEGRPSVSSEDAVARIRQLRDEWDD
ncbi:hypothetical protein ACFFP0_22290 [Rhizobium puerariae]|uniref:Uncharacterized protein n=1 Tax=Rhizobium puerariae TaxID=1585791 RepID=A0ABV6ALT8_9HYPH